MKITKTLAAAVAAGTLLTGIGLGAGSALAADSPGAGRAGAARNFDCANADAVKAKLEAAKAKVPGRVQERIADLEEWKALAQDAGRDRAVERIQQRIDRLGGKAEKVTARIDKLEQKIDGKCAAQ